MSDARDPYPPPILEHGRNPRNATPPERATHAAERDNPLCGDRIDLRLRIEAGRVAEIGYDAEGCLLSLAAASLMSEACRGGTPGELAALADDFEAVLHGHASASVRAALGTLDSFAPLAEHPMRRSCAALPWDALRAALRLRAGR